MKLLKENILLFCLAHVFLTGCVSFPERSGKVYVKNPSAYTIYRIYFQDPRAGVYANSGRSFSFTDNFSSIPILGFPARFCSAFYAGSGESETQYVFNKYCDSPAEEYNIKLLLKMYGRGIYSKEKLQKYFAGLLEKGYFSYSLLNAMIVLKMPLPTEILQDDVMFRRWCIGNGIDAKTSQGIKDKLNLMDQKLVGVRLRERMSKNILNIMPCSIELALHDKIIDRDEAGAMFRLRFYTILRETILGRQYSLPHQLDKEITREEFRKEHAEVHSYVIDAKRRLDAVRERKMDNGKI